MKLDSPGTGASAGIEPGEVHQRLFLQGSRTYYNASKFFPPEKRELVTLLYAFVRKADSLVDDMPQDREGFLAFRRDYEALHRAAAVDRQILASPEVDPVIAGFVYLEYLLGFDVLWAQAFLDSMAMDLEISEYDSIDETLNYIYGSAEVIGLFMAKIMGLNEASFDGAKMLGRAMQYINFLRDADEDRQLGRRYLPLVDTPLTSLDEAECRAKPQAFLDYYRRELERFRGWQKEADRAFSYIPRRYRIPIRTASDMYLWTAEQIYEDPWIIFQRQVKPSKTRVLVSGASNWLRGGKPRRLAY